MRRQIYTLALAAVGLAVVQTACSAAARRQEYAAAAERMQACAAQFCKAVEKSAAAKVRKMSSTGDDEQEYPVPKKEYDLLREILAHTAAVPPALETDETGWRDEPDVVELIFADAQGGELIGVVVNHDCWMRRSEAERMRPQPTRSWRTPHWSLPDAELATLHRLPCMQHAKRP